MTHSNLFKGICFGVTFLLILSAGCISSDTLIQNSTSSNGSDYESVVIPEGIKDSEISLIGTWVLIDKPDYVETWFFYENGTAQSTAIGENEKSIATWRRENNGAYTIITYNYKMFLSDGPLSLIADVHIIDGNTLIMNWTLNRDNTTPNGAWTETYVKYSESSFDLVDSSDLIIGAWKTDEEPYTDFFMFDKYGGGIYASPDYAPRQSDGLLPCTVLRCNLKWSKDKNGVYLITTNSPGSQWSIHAEFIDEDTLRMHWFDNPQTWDYTRITDVFWD